jgi:hypothetical protein
MIGAFAAGRPAWKMTTGTSLPGLYCGVIKSGRSGDQKARFIMTGITRRSLSGYMTRRLAAGEYAIVAGFTDSGQGFENTAYVTGFAGDTVVFAFQRKARGDVVECGGVVDGCGRGVMSYVVL